MIIVCNEIMRQVLAPTRASDNGVGGGENNTHEGSKGDADSTDTRAPDNSSHAAAHR